MQIGKEKFFTSLFFAVSWSECCMYIENSGQEIRRNIRLLGYLLSNQHCYVAVTDSELRGGFLFINTLSDINGA